MSPLLGLPTPLLTAVSPRPTLLANIVGGACMGDHANVEGLDDASRQVFVNLRAQGRNVRPDRPEADPSTAPNTRPGACTALTHHINQRMRVRSRRARTKVSTKAAPLCELSDFSTENNDE